MPFSTLFSKLAIRSLAACFLSLSVVGAASAEVIVGTGTLVKKDTYGTQTEWGKDVSLPRDGMITRVMDGTYGFSIRNASGERVADFLDPQDAVGTKLSAGDYSFEPYVCTQHRHHHVEVSVKY